MEEESGRRRPGAPDLPRCHAAGMPCEVRRSFVLSQRQQHSSSAAVSWTERGKGRGVRAAGARVFEYVWARRRAASLATLMSEATISKRLRESCPLALQECLHLLRLLVRRLCWALSARMRVDLQIGGARAFEL